MIINMGDDDLLIAFEFSFDHFQALTISCLRANKPMKLSKKIDFKEANIY